MRIHQIGYWIPDWIRFVAQVDTGYRIGYNSLTQWIPDTDWIHIFEMDRIPDWIQIFVKVDTGYRIGYEICLILMDTVSGHPWFILTY